MSKLIMVMDDNQDILDLYQEIFTQEGYEVVLCQYQPREINLLEQILPDLLIVDLLLEGKEVGWQLAQQVRLNHQLSHLPIIVCSGDITRLNSLEPHFKAQKLIGLCKPFDLEELLEMVKDVFAQSSSVVESKKVFSLVDSSSRAIALTAVSPLLG